MADTYDVLTLEEAKEVLRIDEEDTVDDAIVERLVTAVSRRFDRFIGPTITRAVTSEIHDGGHCAIELQHGPVASIAAVLEYQSTSLVTLTPQTATSEPSEGWFGERYAPDRTLYSGIIIRTVSGSRSHFWAGNGNVLVTYTAGRTSTTTAVDDRIKEAAAVTLRNWWRSYEMSSGNLGEFDVPTQAFPMFGIPNAARDMLADMWRPEVGFGA